jgi:hypothetical protein
MFQSWGLGPDRTRTLGPALCARLQRFYPEKQERMNDKSDREGFHNACTNAVYTPPEMKIANDIHWRWSDPPVIFVGHTSS